MSDYIKREDALKALSEIAVFTDVAEDVVNAIPSVTFLEAFENYRIEGFSLKELTLFADSCRRNGVTDKELHGWALNVGRAYDYLLGKMQEQLDEYITGGGKE